MTERDIPESLPGRLGSPAVVALMLTVAALALRMAVQVWRSGHDPLYPFFLNDAGFYHQWARGMAPGTVGAPFYLPPLFPALVGLVYKVAGPTHQGMIWLHSFLGTGVIVGIYRLGLRLYGLRTGLFAGLAALLFAPLVWYEGWLLPTVLNVFLLTVAMNLAIEMPAALGRPRRSLVLAAVLGLVLGIASLNRPQNLLLLAGLALWIWLPMRRQRWRPAVLLLACAFVVILPVTIRNIRVGGEPVLISANGGANFYIGNAPGADGRFNFPEGFPAHIDQQGRAVKDLAGQRSGRPVTWNEASRYWFGQGIETIVSHPGQAMKLTMHKLRLAVSWREMENNFVAGWVHRHVGIARWMIPSLGLLWLLAIPGLVATIRWRHPADWPLWILTVSVLLVCLMFWVSTRNRLPLMIPLCVFTGLGLARFSLWKNRVAVAAVLLIALPVFWPTADREGATFLVDIGRTLAQNRRPTEARVYFEEAVEIEPENLMALNGIALTYMDEGNPRMAVTLLQDLIRKYPDFEMARQNLQSIRQAMQERAPR